MPYNLPGLLDGVRAGRTVFHVEGCKDADTARDWLGVSVTTSGGVTTWLPEYRRFYVGADVVIIPDNDEEGRAYSQEVAQSIFGVANSLKILELPGLPEKGDLTNYKEQGGTKEEFLSMVEEAPEYPNGIENVWSAPTEPTPGTSIADVGITKALSAFILRDEGAAFAQDEGGKLYRFSEGTYRQYAERYIKQKVKHLLEAWGESARWSSHRASEVAEYIRADAPVLWECPPLGEVNVLNGILNLKTKRLRDHDPAFLSPVQIPVAYDPEATCEEWDTFASTTYPEDAQELPYEIAADLITPSRSSQKALLFLGEGSNGKSTALGALTAFVGSTNTAGVSLHKLETDRFATSRIIGKLANICPDLPSTHLTETSVFKAITGGDRLNAEYKYRESFEFKPYCRLVFSANHVPRSGDASHAFFRRWLVVPFDRTFDPSEAIPREELDAKLSDPKQLSGVLNRALEVLPRVRSVGFTESKKMGEAWEEFHRMTDPVSVWLEKNTIESAEAYVSKDVLAKAYNEFCDQSGRPGLNKKGFVRAVKRVFPNIEDGQRSLAGKMSWCWIGIGLKKPPASPGGDGSGEGGGDGSGTAGNGTNGTNGKNATCFVNGEKEENGGGKGVGITRRESSVSSVSEQEKRIQRLVHEGMSEKLAREAVLGKDSEED